MFLYQQTWIGICSFLDLAGLVKDAYRIHNISKSELQKELVLDDPLYALKMLVHEGEVGFTSISRLMLARASTRSNYL